MIAAKRIVARAWMRSRNDRQVRNDCEKQGRDEELVEVGSVGRGDDKTCVQVRVLASSGS